MHYRRERRRMEREQQSGSAGVDDAGQTVDSFDGRYENGKCSSRTMSCSRSSTRLSHQVTRPLSRIDSRLFAMALPTPKTPKSPMERIRKMSFAKGSSPEGQRPKPTLDGRSVV